MPIERRKCLVCDGFDQAKQALRHSIGRWNPALVPPVLQIRPAVTAPLSRPISDVVVLAHAMTATDMLCAGLPWRATTVTVAGLSGDMRDVIATGRRGPPAGSSDGSRQQGKLRAALCSDRLSIKEDGSSRTISLPK